MTTRNAAFAVLAAVAAPLLWAAPAAACSHLWKLNEVYTNADGTIQFIEMHVPTGANAEIFLAGLKVRSVATGNIFQFPGNLSGPTGFQYLLLATQAFADLPGAPAPDFILIPNFFSVNGDTIVYHIYDSWHFTAEQLPDECSFSLNRDGTTGPNTPTNFKGTHGFVDPCAIDCPADLDGSGTVDASDLAQLLGAWGTADETADLNADGTVDASDLAIVLGAWGRCA